MVTSTKQFFRSASCVQQRLLIPKRFNQIYSAAHHWKEEILGFSMTYHTSKSVIMSTPFKGGRHIVLLRLASASASASALASALALASGLTLSHPLLNFFLGAPKYDPSYIEIIFHWRP